MLEDGLSDCEFRKSIFTTEHVLQEFLKTKYNNHLQQRSLIKAFQYFKYLLMYSTNKATFLHKKGAFTRVITVEMGFLYFFLTSPFLLHISCDSEMLLLINSIFSCGFKIRLTRFEMHIIWQLERINNLKTIFNDKEQNAKKKKK